jgi:hypothetical protein
MTTLTKTVKRKTRYPFRHYKGGLVVELLDGDLIRIRESRRKESSAKIISIQDLYSKLCVWSAFRERMEKAKAKKAKATPRRRK